MTADQLGQDVSISTMRYTDYLQLEQLLGSQRPLSWQTPSPIHDEHFFITLHQVHELWFKQMRVEADAIIERPTDDQDAFQQILPKLKRMVAIQRQLNAQLELLQTLDSEQFWSMRSLLGSASGSQSLQFTLIEVALGTVTPQHAGALMLSLPPVELSQLKAAFERPTLHDQVAQVLEAAWRQNANASPSARQAAQAWQQQWADLLQAHKVTASGPPDQRTAQNGRTLDCFERLPLDAALMALDVTLRSASQHRTVHETLRQLCDLEEAQLKWRQIHADFVHQLLGSARGTGGTSGYRDLKANASARRRSAMLAICTSAQATWLDAKVRA